MNKQTPSIHDFFRAAYVDLNGRADITPAALFAHADSLYIVWRDAMLGQWAEAVYEKHGVKLVPLMDKLLNMVERVDEEYYNRMATSDVWGEDEDVAEALAWSTAVLRWHHNVHAGRVTEGLGATVADAAVWLESYRAIPVPKVQGQMSLFL